MTTRTIDALTSGIGLATTGPRGTRRHDGLAERQQLLRVADERLARAFAPVAERLAAEREVVAALLDDATCQPEVEELARAVDAAAPADLELRLGERRRALV